MDDYLRMVRACAERDRTEVILRSTRMGFLTGAQPAPTYAQLSLGACPLECCPFTARVCFLQSFKDGHFRALTASLQRVE